MFQEFHEFFFTYIAYKNYILEDVIINNSLYGCCYTSDFNAFGINTTWAYATMLTPLKVQLE